MDNLNWDNLKDKPSTFTPSTHTHKYLPLSGGTISGDLAVRNSVTFLSDGKLKIWNVTSTRNPNYGKEMVFVQTSIDDADPETSWPDKNRNDLFLQPKGGHVHIGPIETAQDYTCYVAGTLRATGTITAPTFSGALSGNASTASKWAAAKKITLTGSVTGSVSIDGSGNVSLATTTNRTTDRTAAGGVPDSTARRNWHETFMCPLGSSSRPRISRTPANGIAADSSRRTPSSKPPPARNGSSGSPCPGLRPIHENPLTAERLRR